MPDVWWFVCTYSKFWRASASHSCRRSFSARRRSLSAFRFLMNSRNPQSAALSSSFSARTSLSSSHSRHPSPSINFPGMTGLFLEINAEKEIQTRTPTLSESFPSRRFLWTREPIYGGRLNRGHLLSQSKLYAVRVTLIRPFLVFFVSNSRSRLTPIFAA